MTRSTTISAVFWDFGGVILSSPFEAFNRFERENGLPLDTIRGINASDPDTNAWARFERSDITADEFDREFAREAAALGHHIRGYQVLSLLRGDVRPEMVRALDLVKAAGFATACLTNNMSSNDSPGTSSAAGTHPHADIMTRFDAVVESSKVGVRKPEVRFYEIACELVGVSPHQCVFLDDLGVNLKPAAAMGMTTIKVISAEQALRDLEGHLGIALR